MLTRLIVVAEIHWTHISPVHPLMHEAHAGFKEHSPTPSSIFLRIAKPCEIARRGDFQV